MKIRLLRNLLIALLPVLLGLGAYFILHIVFPPVPVLVFRADYGSALAVMGAVGSLMLLMGVGGWLVSAWLCQQRLEQSRRADEDSRRRFLRQLDHELKNPLTGLRAALANLGQTGSLDNDPAQQRALADSRHQVGRLSRLVADLRKLAELEERPLESAPVDLSAVLEEAVEAALLLPQYQGRQVNQVISQVPWPLPQITGDRDLLSLVFYNLIENALKYSAPQDAVEVRAAEDGRWLNVEVADSGTGIAGEDLPRIFEELYRGTNARGLEGSGLGLALVRRVVERHGGEVSVRSRQAGRKGTVFRVRLPVR
jgi:two-component system, OmpR family, sensor kinase